MGKPVKKLIINCKHCKGSGVLKDGICVECQGHGYKLVDKEIYYRQLRMEQKHRLEKEK